MIYFNYYKLILKEMSEGGSIRSYFDRSVDIGEEFNESFLVSVHYNDYINNFEKLLVNAGLSYVKTTFLKIVGRDKKDYSSERIFVLSKDDYDLFCILFEEGNEADANLNIVYMGWLERSPNNYRGTV